MKRACIFFDSNFKAIGSISDIPGTSLSGTSTNYKYRLEAVYDVSGIQIGLELCAANEYNAIFATTGDRFLNAMAAVLTDPQKYSAEKMSQAFLEKALKDVLNAIWLCSLWYVHMISTKKLVSTKRVTHFDSSYREISA